MDLLAGPHEQLGPGLQRHNTVSVRTSLVVDPHHERCPPVLVLAPAVLFSDGVTCRELPRYISESSLATLYDWEMAKGIAWFRSMETRDYFPWRV